MLRDLRVDGRDVSNGRSLLFALALVVFVRRVVARHPDNRTVSFASWQAMERADSHVQLGRQRIGPEPLVIERLTRRQSLRGVEGENLVDEIGESFISSAPPERYTSAGESKERRGWGGEGKKGKGAKRRTHFRESARMVRGWSFHWCFSASGILRHPGQRRLLGEPHALREEQRLASERATEGE